MTPEERATLIAKYARGFQEVADSLAGLGPRDLTVRPAPDRWCAAEIVHHLADSESISAQRLRALIAQERPLIHGYDQVAYARLLRYAERPIAPALDAFRAARATTLQLLETMTEADWIRPGWHTESGPYTAETWLRIYAEHAHQHAQQIRRLAGMAKADR
jgi:hypothetical protein